MNFKAIITIGERAYTVVVPNYLDLRSAEEALKHVRETLLVGGVFVQNDREAVEINCQDRYKAIRIVEDVEAPVLPAVEPAEADQVADGNKEYSLANVAAFNYLGQAMNVSILVYYVKNHRILLPSVINGSHAYGYMGEKNVVELINKIALQRLLLTPDAYTVLLYPGPLVDMEDGIEYMREWAKGYESDKAYVPKIKNAKAFTGWNEKG